MRILHILDDKKQHNNDETQRFLRLIALFKNNQIEQSVLCSPSAAREQALDNAAITYKIEKFGGLFDLHTKQALRDMIEDFSPHIILSHNYNAAAFIAAVSGDNIPHIGLLHDNPDDRRIAAKCDHTLLIKDNEPDDIILKKCLSRFADLLKKQAESTKETCHDDARPSQ